MEVGDWLKSNKSTISVAVAEDSKGKSYTLVGINRSVGKDEKVKAALLKVVSKNEIVVPMQGEGLHAKENIYDFAKTFGLTVKSIDANRPLCVDCNTIRKQNLTTTSTNTSNQKSKKRR